MHQVYFGDEITRWRCMKCDCMYSSVEWIASGGEIVKVGYWRGCKRVRKAEEGQNGQVAAGKGLPQ